MMLKKGNCFQKLRIAEAMGLVGLLAVGLGQARGAEWEGKPVVAVRQVPENPGEIALDPATLEEALTQKAGEPYSSARIRESLERLYATGRFADIRVDAQQEPQGVVVTFLTQARYFVGSVRVQGVPAPPTESQLRSATQLQLGAPFSEEEVPGAVERLRQVLEEDGYFQAEIVPRFAPHPETQQTDIFFEVRSGERARLGEVRVTGRPVFAAARLLREAEWESGEPFTSERVQNGMTRLRNLYREENYLQASLRVARRLFHRQGNRVDLELEITAGTPVEVSVSGASISRSRLAELLPIFEEGALDEDLHREGERNLRDHFESQGYFQVEVSHTEATRPDRMSLEYRVNLGDRQRLQGIEFTGNRYFQTAALRERMRIEPATLTSRQGRFSRRALEQDLASIRALYQSNGFAQVEVQASWKPSGPGSQEDILVLVEIREGAQTLVGRFSIAGNRSFSEDELAGYLNAAPGQPYSESLAASDRNNLLTFYWNGGFPGARFEWQTIPSEDGRLVDLRYLLEEGEREYVRHIFVGGLENTRAGIVNRQLQLQDGQPLSQGRVLDTQRRLYDLGIFSRVEMALQNARAQERQRTLLVYLEEARRYTVKLGLGAEVGRFGGSREDAANVEGENEFSPDVSLDVTRLNVGGRPHIAGVRTRFSALQKRAGFTYTAPRFLNYEWLNASIRAFFDETRDVRTFTAKRLEGSLQLESKRSRVTTLLYRYAFRRITVDTDTLRISPEQIPILSRPVLVGTLGLSWIRDTRDVPMDARQGLFTTADLAVAAKQMGSETSFVRGLLQNSSYHRIGRNFVLARSTQFAAQTPFGKARRIEVPPGEEGRPGQEVSTRDIPIAERFFSGGGNSHRGFGLNQAGPRDLVTGFAVGGDALLLNSLEFRFPIWRRNITGVLFQDAGNVYRRIGSLSLRQHQKSLADFNYVSHAVGLGVRYQTPVAPVRLDVGYNLNPPRFLVQTGDTLVQQNLSRWQVLFSVGQTF